ncbi:MAG: hypothetical protein OXF20_04240 [Gammaproteobacteria bacterium]|nr:hypothetical protein [Gammaproteobacteria bacterium]
MRGNIYKGFAIALLHRNTLIAEAAPSGFRGNEISNLSAGGYGCG